MNPSIRIGLSITVLTVGVLLFSDFVFQIFPSEYNSKIEARVKYCETLAKQFSLLLEANKVNSVQIEMDAIVAENSEVRSIGMRLIDGSLIANTSQHPTIITEAESSLSTPTEAFIPIYQNKKKWGKLEIFFHPVNGGLLESILNNSLFKLITFVLTVGFFAYTFFIKRTLRYLDPSSVIPGRVKATLDQLVEGIVLVDGRYNIVLANNTFAKLLGKTSEDLIGKNLNSFEWRLSKKLSENESETELPWMNPLDQLGRVTDARVILLGEMQNHILSVNASLIKDGNKQHKGILVSFDDISEIEQKNAELVKTIEHLEKAELKIREQNDELRRLASVDPLSGALNRRAFFEKLELEYKLASQEGLFLSCLMVDIDHFKLINDNYGHAVGDEVIKGMSQILLERCISNGAVGRYGGEEFCLVLPGMTYEDALKLGELIRMDLINWSIKSDSPTSGKKITASLGQSSINNFAQSGASMVDQADQALYYSKENGRNQVTSWFRLPQQTKEAV